MQKKVKELQDRMNDLRRWHNSKQHILEIKIKENVKAVSELEARKKELENQLKFKAEIAMKKAGEYQKVNGKAFQNFGIKINSQPTAKFLKNQLTVKDLQQMSPKDQIGSDINQIKTIFLMTGR